MSSPENSNNIEASKLNSRKKFGQWQWLERLKLWLKRLLRLGVIIGLVVLVYVGAWAVWWVWLAVEEAKLAQPGDFAKAITGLGVFAGGAVLFMRLWVDDKRRETEERRVNNERLHDAVRMLSEDTEMSRFGALSSLKHLAEDSPVHKATIVSTICAYVRQRSTQWTQARVSIDVRGNTIEKLIEHHKQDKFRNLPKLTEDLKTAFRVLDELHKNVSDKERRQKIELENLQLPCVNFETLGAELRGFNLERANLTGAKLKKFNLQGAQLSAAQLEEAILEKAELEGAILNRAMLDTASFVEFLNGEGYPAEGLNWEMLKEVHSVNENTALNRFLLGFPDAKIPERFHQYLPSWRETLERNISLSAEEE